MTELGRWDRLHLCYPSDGIGGLERYGEVLWTETSFGYATLLKVDGKLLILKTDGVLVLARANPERFEEVARARVSRTTCRALPALAHGLLYVRDSRRLVCIDLRSKGNGISFRSTRDAD